MGDKNLDEFRKSINMENKIVSILNIQKNSYYKNNSISFARAEQIYENKYKQWQEIQEKKGKVQIKAILCFYWMK